MAPLSDAVSMVLTQVFGQPTLPVVDLKGRTFIVTGANTGLGFEEVKHLIQLGASRVIIACRNLDKGNDAKLKAMQEVKHDGSYTLDVWQLDLSSFDSVLAFGRRVQSELTQLDGFIANAGVELFDFHRVEGLEQHLTVNVISTMLSAITVIPKLRETAKATGRNTNLTLVGSLYHFVAADEQLNIPAGNEMLEYLSDESRADMQN